MKTIVIAGGEGFIGQNLKTHFKDYNVVSIDLKPTADMVFNLEDTWPWVGGEIEAVICAASEPNIWGSTTPPDVNHESRIVQEGMRFCDSFNVKKFIHLSSSNVYGGGYLEPPFKEHLAVSPTHRYGLQKLFAERTVRRRVYNTDMAAVSLRLFNVMGHLQRKTMFPYIVAENLFRGVPIPVYGDRWRSWTPVYDVCRFIRIVLQGMTPGYDVFNYGRTQMWNQQKLIDVFERRLNVTDRQANAVPWILQARPDEMHVSQPCVDKAYGKFGQGIEPRYQMAFCVDDVINTVAHDLGIVLQSD